MHEEMCDKAGECGLLDTTVDTEREDSVRECKYNAAFPCSGADGIDASAFDACMKDIASADCATIEGDFANGHVRLPDSCDGAVIIKR